MDVNDEQAADFGSGSRFRVSKLMYAVDILEKLAPAVSLQMNQ